MNAVGGRQNRTLNYRFTSFDDESRGETIAMSVLILIDENRAAAAMIAAGTFFVTAFFFGYGAGGVVDSLLKAVLP